MRIIDIALRIKLDEDDLRTAEDICDELMYFLAEHNLDADGAVHIDSEEDDSCSVHFSS